MGNSKEYEHLFKEAFTEIKQENESLGAVNILVAGKSGVGKSTLINAVFGDELAATGVGKPVTDKIDFIEQDGFPVRIYDTVGFELSKQGFDLGQLVKSFTGNDIQHLVKKVQSTETDEDDIHVVWYMISGSSARIEDAEIQLIKWMKEHKLPVLVVLTKSFDQVEAQALNQEIKTLIPEVDGVINVLAKDSEFVQAFGIEELIKDTFTILPEGLKASFVHSQEASKNLKRNEAIKEVATTMAISFTSGFGNSLIDNRNADGKEMIDKLTGMMAKITSIYGVDVDQRQVDKAFTSVMGVFTALLKGEKIVGSLLNKLPVAGAVGSGLVSGGVGMVVTGALGYAYIELMDNVLSETINLNAIAQNDLTQYLIDKMPNYLPQ